MGFDLYQVTASLRPSKKYYSEDFMIPLGLDSWGRLALGLLLRSLSPEESDSSIRMPSHYPLSLDKGAAFLASDRSQTPPYF